MIVSRCYSTRREGAIALFQGVNAYRTGQERTGRTGKGPAGQERTSRTGQERTVKDRTARQLRTGQWRTDRPGRDQQDRKGLAGQERTSRTGQERTVKDRTAKQLL